MEYKDKYLKKEHGGRDNPEISTNRSVLEVVVW